MFRTQSVTNAAVDCPALPVAHQGRSCWTNRTVERCLKVLTYCACAARSSSIAVTTFTRVPRVPRVPHDHDDDKALARPRSGHFSHSPATPRCTGASRSPVAPRRVTSEKTPTQAQLRICSWPNPSSTAAKARQRAGHCSPALSKIDELRRQREGGEV